MYVIVFNAVKKKEHQIKILWSMVLGSLIPMAIGYYQFLTGTGHAWKSAYYASRRPDSCLGEWNIYGEFLCISIVAGLILFFMEKRFNKNKILLAGILTSLLFSLIISLNRGSWISFAIGLSVASIVFIRKIKLRWVVITGVVISLSMGGLIYQRFKQLDQKKDGFSQNTLEGRIYYWQKLFPLIFRKPIVGHGIGASVIVGDRYLKKGMAPHNDYLRLALEIGIPGSLLYIAFLSSVFLKELKSAMKSGNWEIGFPMLMIISYVIILSAFQNIIFNVTIFPMFMALLALSHKASKLAAHRYDPKC